MEVRTENQINNNAEAIDSNGAARRPYSTPKLTSLGAIQTLVQSGASGPSSDVAKPEDASVS